MKNILVSPNLKIIKAMKKLDVTGERCLIVTDKENKLLGTLNDGDVRRGILQGANTKHSIKAIYSKKPIVLFRGKYTLDKVKRLLNYHIQGLNLLPILDSNKVVVGYFSRENVFGIKKKDRNLQNISVVVMAGGKGDRLLPFTKVLPKPLIPVNDKPVIEHII